MYVWIDGSIGSLQLDDSVVFMRAVDGQRRVHDRLSVSHLPPLGDLAVLETFAQDEGDGRRTDGG